MLVIAPLATLIVAAGATILKLSLSVPARPDHHPADLLQQLRSYRRRQIGDVATWVIFDDIGSDDRLRPH